MASSVFCCRFLSRRTLTSLFVLGLPLAGASEVTPFAIAAPGVDAPTTRVATPPTPAPQLLVAQGTVRDSDGKPLKGATVALLRVSQAGKQDLAALITRTDEQGHFVIEGEFSPDIVKAMTPEVGPGGGEPGAPRQAPRLPVLIHAPGFATKRWTLNTALQKRPDLPANDLTLTPGFSTRGKIVDADGKPVVGAIMRPSWVQTSLDPESESRFVSFGSLSPTNPFWALLQTTSDAEGIFTLRDLPAGTLSAILDDPRFVVADIELPVNEASTEALPTAPLGKESTLTARVGGTLKGRVLYLDGKPVNKVTVTARSGDGRDSTNAKTGADGTYTLTRVRPGKITLSTAAPSPDWAVTGGPDFEIKSGQTATAPDLKLSPGVLLEGFVRDSESKAPLEGVSVSSYTAFREWTTALTDARGRYQMRLPVGVQEFSVNGVPADYIQSYNGASLTVAEQSRKAPDFLLSKGVTLTGTAKDEKGQPAVGAVISVRSDFGGDTKTTVNAAGQWTLRGVNPKDWGGQRANSVQLKVLGAWDLQGEAKVTLPAPPLALTLRRITLQDATVRVLTPGGQPVPDAKVTYKLFLNPEHNSWRNGNAVSNTKGEVILPKLRPEQAVELTASKAGYVLAHQGTVAGGTAKGAAANEGAARAITDIVMTPLDTQISGRVLDAEGQPAAGVTVAALFPNDLRDLPEQSVQTDAQGRFTLKGLAGGEVTLGAARGRAFGQTTLQAGQVAELKLGAEEPIAPPKAVDLAFQQLERWTKQPPPTNGNNAQQWEYQISGLAAKLARYDADRAQRLMTGANGTVNQVFVYSAPLSVALVDAKRALALSKELFPQIKDPNLLLDMRLRLAARIAAGEPEAARQVYEEIAPGIVPGALTPEAARRYAELAALSAALKNPDTEGWLQALTLSLAAFPEASQNYYLESVAKLLAAGDLLTARRWVAQLKPDAQLQTLGSLVAWAAKRDVVAARAMLDDMTALAARPDFPVPPTRNDGNYRPSAAMTIDTARVALVRALMSTDLKAAQALARDLAPTAGDNIGLRNEIAVRLSGVNDDDIVRAAFQDAANQSWEHPSGDIARLAVLAAKTLPQASAQGLRDARAKLAERRTDRGSDEAAAFYAYALANLNPAESRLLLENEWLRARQALKAGKAVKADGVQQPIQWETLMLQTNVIRAMLPLSVTRANEMLQLAQANDSPFLNGGEIIGSIIDWLLGDENARLAPLAQRPERRDDDD